MTILAFPLAKKTPTQWRAPYSKSDGHEMPFTNPENLLYYSSTVELETYIDWAWGKQTPGPPLQSDRNTDFLLRQIEGAGGLPGKIINLFFSGRLEVAKKLIPWNEKSEGTFWLTQCFSLFSCHLLFLKAFSSVAQSCPTLWDSMDCSAPGLPVHHQLPEST